MAGGERPGIASQWLSVSGREAAVFSEREELFGRLFAVRVAEPVT